MKQHKHSMVSRLAYAVIAALSLCIAVAAPAAEEHISLKQVIEQVLHNHPDLRISHIDSAIAATDSERIQGLLDPHIQASAGIAQDQTPVSSSFQPTETRIARFDAGASKTLAFGDTLGVDFRYNRNLQLFNSPFASQLASINPAYRSQMNLSYRHPLLKGNGLPAYAQGLAAAEQRHRASRLQSAVLAHQLALTALNLFYQMALDDVNIHYARLAVDRARRLLAYQRQRETFGLIEETDRLQAEALLATRQTQLQQAIARRETDQTSLNRLMLQPATRSLHITLPPVAADTPEPLPEALQQARRTRPELHLLEARLKAAEADLLIARDEDQVQLDVIAELGTRALDAAAAGAAGKTFSINDHYAALSLELSDTITGHREKAAIRSAELRKQRIQAEHSKSLETIHDELAAAATAIRTITPTVSLTRKQAAVELRKFNEELERYRQGRTDTATLVQFEGDLHNAELQAELQRLRLQLAQQQYLWAKGQLMSSLGIAFASAADDRTHQ